MSYFWKFKDGKFVQISAEEYWKMPSLTELAIKAAKQEMDKMFERSYEIMTTKVKFDLPKDTHQEYDFGKVTYTVPTSGDYKVSYGPITVYYKDGILQYHPGQSSSPLRGDASCKVVPECEHEMVAYNGLTESYNFCKKCDKKDNV